MNGKTILAFLAGAVAGTAAGYYVVKTVLTKQHDEDLQNVRDFYDEKVRDLEKENADLKNSLTPVEVEEDTVKENKSKSKTTKKKTEDIKEAADLAEKLDYTTFTKEEAKPKTTKKKSSPKSDIFVIDEDEFKANSTGFDQSTITYFSGEDKFLDEYEEEIPNGKELVGAENLSKFSEDNLLYVRNSKLATEYEVILENRSISEYMESEYGE